MKRNLLAWMVAGMLALVGGAALAVDKFATPTGAGSQSGDDWANAYGSVQTAINACAGGGTVYLKQGIYTNAPTLVVSNVTGLAIQGGYTGSGFTRGGVPSILTRHPTNTIRILNGYGSTFTLDTLTVSNGYTTVQGGGLNLVNCQATVTNCLLTRNGNFALLTNLAGGGIYASGGKLWVRNSAFVVNGAPVLGSSWGSARGGAIYATGADLVLRDTVFDRNDMNGYDNSGAGVLYANGGTHTILNCAFTRNNSRAYYDQGLLFLNSVAGATISNCTFGVNTLTGWNGVGVILFSTACPSGVRILDCQFTNNVGSASQAALYVPGAGGNIQLRNCVMGRNAGSGILKTGNGALSLTNCLVYANGSYGVRSTLGTLNIGNSTVADNSGWGVVQAGGTVVLKDCL